LIVDAFSRFHGLTRFFIDLVCDKSLQRSDVNGFIDETAVASVLTAMIADASADAREGVVLFDYPDRIFITTFMYQSDVTLGALSGWTCIPAWGDTQFLDGVGVRDALGVELMGCAAIRKPLVKGIWQNHWTHISAVAAANAFGDVDIARFVAQGDLEISGLAFYSRDFGIDEKVDVEMPSCIDQLGADSTHGAVIGGEGLIELSHVAADSGVAFNEMHEVALISKIETGLHSGDPCADDHHRSN
jgi:hypothetical protein